MPEGPVGVHPTTQGQTTIKVHHGWYDGLFAGIEIPVLFQRTAAF